MTTSERYFVAGDLLVHLDDRLVVYTKDAGLRVGVEITRAEFDALMQKNGWTPRPPGGNIAAV